MSITDLQTDYAGRRGALFGLALRASLLTVLSLGIYRFWMKTRLRRYYWSSIRPGGQPLEYVGEPLEKLLGFLIAVVFLSFYIGVVNLLLMFFSFSLLNSNVWAYVLSGLGVLPILFYARYRARRYILARTRWRGVRFGMEPGAWGYTWRALLHWAITILTAGLLWPRMTFLLEKYRTDRTFFGHQRFHQGGRWQMLYRAYLPFLAGLITIAGAGAIFYVSADISAILAGSAGAMLALYGLAHYRVHSFRIMMNYKTVGGVGFLSQPRPWRVLWIYSLGYALVVLALTVLFVLFVMALVGFLSANDLPAIEDLGIADLSREVPVWILSLGSALLYFSVFIIWGALTHVLVTLPVARHYAQTLAITGAASLPGIYQRARDELEQAEGFAEALDVGAAI